MASDGVRDPHAAGPESNRAKAYSRIKLAIGIASSLISFGLLVVFIATGWTRVLATWCTDRVGNDYLALIAFAACLGALQLAFTLPLSWYASYHVEHAFGLSNQSVGRWISERVKGFAISMPFVLCVLCILYFSLRSFGAQWWIPVASVLVLLSVLLTWVAPLVIMPIFYRFTPIDEGPLRRRIALLCEKAGMHFDGIFSFNMSKNTKKANAGFTGIGRSKRIILGDTLLQEFTEEEIETVFAHELGHYRFGHIRKAVVLGTVSTFLGLFITSWLYDVSLKVFGFGSRTDLAAMPLLAIGVSLFGLFTSPIGNMISRKHEWEADAYAVQHTGKRGAFASALRRLAAMNLADPEPHPLVEFLFYSHPSIGKRIKALEQREP